MSPEKPLDLRRVRDFGATISDTFAFLRLHWRPLATLYALFVVPFLLLATLLGADAFPSLFQSLSKGFDGILSELVAVGPRLLLSALNYLIGTTLYPTLVYLYMRRVDESPGVRPALRDCTRQLLPKTLLNLGYVLVLVLALGLGLLIVLLPVLGVLLYIPAVMWLVVCFTILTPVVVIEDRPFPTAFSRAVRLVTGRWWYTLGVVMVIGLICYFLSSIISIAVNLVTGQAAINFLDPEKDLGRIFDRNQILISGISFIVQQVFYLVLHVCMGIHYFSLVEVKDARGLEARLDSLGSGGRGPAASLPEEQY
jgi:hypothetical protein